MITYHFTHIKFIDLSSQRIEGRKLKITYIDYNNDLKNVSIDDDTNIHIQHIKTIVKGALGKGNNWKNVTENMDHV